MEDAIMASWASNALPWTRAVREGLILSRRTVTDNAVLRALATLSPRHVLDVGCGEGWLARELARRGARVIGIDGSEALIDLARRAGDGPEYRCLSYEEVVANARLLGEGYDVAVANFSLLGEQLLGLLTAIRESLRTEGSLVVQTVHPASVLEPERLGWRTESFSTLEAAGRWTPMPWFLRSLSDWQTLLKDAGYSECRFEEPMLTGSHVPASLILIAKP